ncbi:hypothetical protein A0H81_04258 [Grifola frondosa]|uniref:Secreted protein n=1 Tax=Grifola frondosa TaxID=5627 RepID=A0A1C7MFW0_GRIFR|nr:hypothetical protein A0H81_04258 [Grifola frondosa]
MAARCNNVWSRWALLVFVCYFEKRFMAMDVDHRGPPKEAEGMSRFSRKRWNLNTQRCCGWYCDMSNATRAVYMTGWKSVGRFEFWVCAVLEEDLNGLNAVPQMTVVHDVPRL